MKIIILMLIVSSSVYTTIDSYPRVGSQTLPQCQFTNQGLRECELDPQTHLYVPKCKAGYSPSSMLCTKTVDNEYFQQPFTDLTTCTQQNPQGCDQSGMVYYPKCKEGYTPYQGGSSCQWSQK